MNILRKASILLLIAVISGFFVITYSFAEAKTLPLNPEIKTLNTENFATKSTSPYIMLIENN